MKSVYLKLLFVFFASMILLSGCWVYSIPESSDENNYEEENGGTEPPTIVDPETINWFVKPFCIDSGNIGMISEKVLFSAGETQYLFECIDYPNISSDWQSSSTYTIDFSDLKKDEYYTFKVKARSSVSGKETGYSDEVKVQVIVTLNSGGTKSLWVNGYYVGYHVSLMPPDKIGWHGLTHISIGAVLVDADKSESSDLLDTRFYQGSESAGRTFATNVCDLAIANNVIPLLQVGGMGNGEDINDATSSSSIEEFADTLIAYVEEVHAKGIDFNWEDHINSEQLKSIIILLKKKKPDLVITYPTGNYNKNYKAAEYDEFAGKIADIVDYLDQINIMSYWGCGVLEGSNYDWYSGHGSCLYNDGKNPISIDNTLGHLSDDIGIPRKKLGLGFSFYAGCYPFGITGPGQNKPSFVLNDLKGGDNSYTFAKLYTSEAYLYAQAHADGCLLWDDKAKCSYIYLPADHTNEYNSQYITYESEKSIQAKADFCRNKGYGGAIIWTIDQGYVPVHNNPHFLMDITQKAFIDPSKTLKPNVTILPNPLSIYSKKTKQIYALITGTNEMYTVDWSMPAGGTIDNYGFLTAGDISGTFTVNVAVPGFSINDSKNITIAEYVEWTPKFKLHTNAEYWKELSVISEDSEVIVQDAYMIYEGVEYKMSARGTNNFSNNKLVTAGDKVRFYAIDSSGRIALSDWINYRADRVPIDMDTECVDQITPDMLNN